MSFAAFVRFSTHRFTHALARYAFCRGKWEIWGYFLTYMYACEGVSFWISYNFFCVRCFCWHLVASIQCQSYRCCLFRFRVSFALSHCSSVLTSLFSCTRPRYPALTRLNIVYKQFVEFYLLCTLVFVLRLFYIQKVILLY